MKASELIDKRIAELADWRGETLKRMRKLIKEADPEVVEEWKWMGTPVWSHDGIICTGESYKAIVKLTFAKGASLKDPAKLFNSSLDGNVRRAIDIHEGETGRRGRVQGAHSCRGRPQYMQHKDKAKDKARASENQDSRIPRRQILFLAAGSTALASMAGITRAQAYPTRPVRILVGFVAGGNFDTLRV